MSEEIPNWGVPGLVARFKITCRKCGSENVVIDTCSGSPGYSEWTGGDPAELSIGCNDCKQNDYTLSV
jgi:hypothetical protein